MFVTAALSVTLFSDIYSPYQTGSSLIFITGRLLVDPDDYV
jgi:hypothetical protein